MSLFSTYLKTLRKTETNLLWLDAGDLYTGTLESQHFDGETISRALNHLGLNATAPGNHEFDFGLDVYQNRLTQQQFPTLVSNMIPRIEQTHES